MKTEQQTAAELIARYDAGDESVWLAKSIDCYDSEGLFLGTDGMTVNTDGIPVDVVWTQSEYLCVGYETIKFVSQEYYGQDGRQDVTTYTVVLRGEQ